MRKRTKASQAKIPKMEMMKMKTISMDSQVSMLATEEFMAMSNNMIRIIEGQCIARSILHNLVKQQSGRDHRDKSEGKRPIHRAIQEEKTAEGLLEEDSDKLCIVERLQSLRREMMTEATLS